jgi:glycosyltransferase involved in cell wall biosynthesis
MKAPSSSRKFKVLMTGTLPTDLQSVIGGVQSAILNLFAGFSQLENIEVTHLSFNQGLPDRKVVDYSSNVKIIFLPFKASFQLVDYVVNYPILKGLIAEEKPDIIHIQESEPHLLRFIVFPRSTIVVTQHGIMREEMKYAQGFASRLKYFFKALVERFGFPFFKHVIFISNYNQRLLKWQLKSSTNIYNAVNPMFFDQQLSKSEKPNSLIYVGVISRRKNLGMVIDALGILKERGIIFELNVVGWYKHDEVEYDIEILKKVKHYGIGDQVKFHGWLKQQEILQVFETCTYFILPSRQETLPVSIAEAMALGKIVLASNVGAVSEMFEDKRTGYLFGRDDSDDLVSLLTRLNSREHPNISRQVVQDEARLKYHPVENARRTIKYYKEVLNLGKL